MHSITHQFFNHSARYVAVGAVHRCNDTRISLHTWTSQRSRQMSGVLFNWPGNRLFGARVRSVKWQRARSRIAMQISWLHHLFRILRCFSVAQRHQFWPLVDSWVFYLRAKTLPFYSRHNYYSNCFERGWRGCNQLSERSKFSLYFVYAWGLALLFTLFAYLLDNHTDIVRLRPGIGEGSCFLKRKWRSFRFSETSKFYPRVLFTFPDDRLTQTIFFYLPIAIIIVINSTFFILTARRIHRVQSNVSKIVARSDSNGKQTKFESHKDKWVLMIQVWIQRIYMNLSIFSFSLFLRLFIMMGVTWSMEVISWAISPDSIFFHLTDAINITQGVLIFILFVCKPKIKRLVQKW